MPDIELHDCKELPMTTIGLEAEGCLVTGARGRLLDPLDPRNCENGEVGPGSPGVRDHGPHGAKLSMLPLACLIFYDVAGGPFGVEDTVKNAGPLLALLGFVFFPLVWSVPEALVTAELATAFPENAGYVIWVSAAFGPYWGFQEGWWKWLSGVIDNSLYPILFLDYLKQVLPIFASGTPRVLALIIITVVLTYQNYRGLTIVGTTAVILTGITLAPFAILFFIALPKIRPYRWLKVPATINWRGYLNTLFWNLNYWDSASTLAGEVENPRKTFPQALLTAVVLVVTSYLIPLLTCIGALDLDSSKWVDGFTVVAGREIAGQWMAWWIIAAAALSSLGMFAAEMSSDAYQLLGMAERGMLPEAFAQRSKYGTPTLSILCSATGILLLSWMTFEQIVELLNFLYCVGMLIEFAAFLWLRFQKPKLARPYRIPLNSVLCCIMLLVPSVLLLIVMSLATYKTMLVSLGVSLLGFVLRPALVYARSNGWMTFVGHEDLPSMDGEPNVECLNQDQDHHYDDLGPESVESPHGQEDPLIVECKQSVT